VATFPQVIHENEYIWNLTFCKPILHWLNQWQPLQHTTRQHLCLCHYQWIKAQWGMQEVLFLWWIRAFRILSVCQVLHLCWWCAWFLQELLTWLLLFSLHRMMNHVQRPLFMFNHQHSCEAQCRCHHQQPFCWWTWFCHQGSITQEQFEWHDLLWFRIRVWIFDLQPFSPTYILCSLCFSDQQHQCLCMFTKPIFSFLSWSSFLQDCVHKKWRLCSYVKNKEIKSNQTALESMPLHITLEKLRGSVMIPAGQVLLFASVLPTLKNGNFWKKHDECKQKQNFLLQELHEKLSQSLFPYHLRVLVIKEEPRSPPSYCIECTDSNDWFPDKFPFSAILSVIPCSDVIQHCLIKVFITFKPPCFITAHCISEIMPIWNCFIKVWKNDSNEESCKPWLRSTTKTIQNTLIPECFGLRWWKVFEVLFEYVLSQLAVYFHIFMIRQKKWLNLKHLFWFFLLQFFQVLLFVLLHT